MPDEVACRYVFLFLLLLAVAAAVGGGIATNTLHEGGVAAAAVPPTGLRKRFGAEIFADKNAVDGERQWFAWGGGCHGGLRDVNFQSGTAQWFG